MRFFYSAIFFLIALSSGAQEVRVKEFQKIEGDLKARTAQRNDLNGDPCALIKVQIPMPEVDFEGWIIDKIYTPGEYLVYVPASSRKLIIKHSSFLPFVYEFTEPLEQKATYRLVLDIPQKNNSSLVRFKINVPQAVLSINGEQHETKKGTISLNLPKGKYDYAVSTSISGFDDYSGTINIEDSPYIEENVNLTTTITHQINIQTDEDVEIFIDNQKQKAKGTSISKSLEAGMHTVEAKLKKEGMEWSRSAEVDLINSDQLVNMSLKGKVRFVYPLDAQFKIIPSEGSLKPSKTIAKTGEEVLLLGNYVIEINKKNYSKQNINITVSPYTENPTFRFEKLINSGDNYLNGWNNCKQDYKKAFKTYKKLAEKGDDIAMCSLAKCYQNGYGTDSNQNSVRFWLEESAKLGNGEAACLLFDISKQSAFPHLKKCFEKGHQKSGEFLGNYYYEKKEYTEALDVFKQLENINNETALLRLGDMYFYGYGVDKDYSLAKDYFIKVATLYNNVTASERLYDFKFHGYEEAENKEEAIKGYLSLGSKLSNDAKLKIAIFRYEEKNYKEAGKYLMSIGSGYKDYPNNIAGIYYRIAYETYKSEPSMSFYFHKNAYDLGERNVDLLINLGYMYLQGNGTKTDYPNAAKFFKEASDKQSLEGMYMYGKLLYEGKGIPKDLKGAYRQFMNAIEKGYKKAYLDLGTMYANGEFVSRDLNTAVRFWTIASEAGQTQATKNLILYYKRMNNPSKVRYWESKLK